MTLLIGPEPVLGLEIGQVVGKYELAQVIGKGGFGAVYRARHLATGQQIALKVLARTHDEIATKRFFQEAQVTSMLKHPNTIRVFDFGQDDAGRLYLAMELLNGRSLRDAMRDRRHEDQVFSERQAAEIGVAVLKSLAEAHRAGLVHRDIKPDNIFLHQIEDEDPVVKLLDFGIAKLGDGNERITSNSAVPGTPTFMSPEHAMNGPLDGRADLYSVGVLLFLMVSGRVPFRAESAVQTLYMHVHLPVPDLTQVARVPLTPHFVSIVNKALQKDPAQRFPSAREMRLALEQCLGEAWVKTTTSNGVVIPSLNLRYAQVVEVVPLSRQATNQHQGEDVARPSPQGHSVTRPLAEGLGLAEALEPSTTVLLPDAEPPPAVARRGRSAARWGAALGAFGAFGALLAWAAVHRAEVAATADDPRNRGAIIIAPTLPPAPSASPAPIASAPVGATSSAAATSSTAAAAPARNPGPRRGPRVPDRRTTPPAERRPAVDEDVLNTRLR